MSAKRTRPLSLGGSREVYEEMKRPPEDTPARREMFKQVRQMAALRARQGAGPEATAKKK